MRIGVVSDTHGYFDPRLEPALAGVDVILHAGDVGSEAVLTALRAIAPVYAVQGNNDVPLGGLGLPEHIDIDLAGVRFHIVHEIAQARPRPHTDVVVFGHSHEALIEQRDGVLYLNPGAAGRRGFHRLQTAALVSVETGRARAELLELGPREPRAVPASRPAKG